MATETRPDPRNVVSGPRQVLLRSYVGIVTAGGLGLIAVVLYGATLRNLPGVDAAFFAVVGLLMLGQLRPLFTAGAPDANGVMVSIAFVFAILLRYDLSLALVVQTLAVVISGVSKRRVLWRTVFNIGQYALSWAAAWWVMGWVGHRAEASVPVDLTGHTLLPALAAACTFFFFNELLVAVPVALTAGTGVWAVLRPNIVYELLTTGALLTLGPLVALSMEAGPGFVPLLVPALIAAYAVGSVALQRENQSMLDPLTGLPNRKRLGERLTEAVREGQVALVLLDLDRFKEVNDTLGHYVGDQLLMLVGERLAGSLRPSDTVARLGGDEFALLLPGADAEVAWQVTERVRLALVEPIVLGGLLVGVTASTGIAVSPEHGTDVDVLLQHADVAMYLSKESGDAEVYDAARDRNSPARLALLGELRRALETDELELHFQPKAELATGRVVGVEALLRWRHPEHGLLTPDAFIPLAERSGLIATLTAWVLDSALAQLARWRSQGWDLELAVNVSVKDLCSGQLVDRVTQGLRTHGIPPSSLQLEVTEGSLFVDSVRARSTLRQLEALGVALSLDDFGTGWSSLVQLRQLPVSELKVDRSFVSRMDEDPRDLAIVSSVIHLARGLGMRVVAEGVEDLATWRRLAALGCHSAQGYWLSPALPAAELDPWLAEQLFPSYDEVSDIDGAQV